VVEDDDQSFELVEFLLAESGFEVLRARDRRELEALAALGEPDLVLLDVNLPSGSGLELLDGLRRVEGRRRVPVVALTAHAMAGDRERFLHAGCDGYISKPIDPGRFAELVRSLLRSGP
jgi:two-component system cell cycle response regulator DivK